MIVLRVAAGRGGHAPARSHGSWAARRELRQASDMADRRTLSRVPTAAW
jgi:hypothetical protein